LIYTAKTIIGIEIFKTKIIDQGLIDVKIHILLSPIYSLPVLYFTGMINSTDGCNIPITSVDDVYKYVIDPHQSQILRGSTNRITPRGAISQCEHPFLENSRYFFIHPCQTADILKVINSDFHTPNITLKSYFDIWIGIMGGLIGISLTN